MHHYPAKHRSRSKFRSSFLLSKRFPLSSVELRTWWTLQCRQISSNDVICTHRSRLTNGFPFVLRHPFCESWGRLPMPSIYLGGGKMKNTLLAYDQAALTKILEVVRTTICPFIPWQICQRLMHNKWVSVLASEWVSVDEWMRVHLQRVDQSRHVCSVVRLSPFNPNTENIRSVFAKVQSTSVCHKRADRQGV